MEKPPPPSKVFVSCGVCREWGSKQNLKRHFSAKHPNQTPFTADQQVLSFFFKKSEDSVENFTIESDVDLNLNTEEKETDYNQNVETGLSFEKQYETTENNDPIENNCEQNKLKRKWPDSEFDESAGMKKRPKDDLVDQIGDRLVEIIDEKLKHLNISPPEEVNVDNDGFQKNDFFLIDQARSVEELALSLSELEHYPEKNLLVCKVCNPNFTPGVESQPIREPGSHYQPKTPGVFQVKPIVYFDENILPRPLRNIKGIVKHHVIGQTHVLHLQSDIKEASCKERSMSWNKKVGMNCG